MKFWISALMVVAITLMGSIHPQSLNAKQEHVYVDGIVNSIGEETITVAEEDYPIAPGCRIVQQVKYKDFFYEKPAELSDVKVNDYVYIKVKSGVVHEIIIEAWKRGGEE